VRKQLVFVAFLITAGCAETPVRSTPSARQTGTPTSSSDGDAAVEHRTDAQARQNTLGAEPSSEPATETADAPRRVDDFVDLIKAYKVAICNCSDHDRECGKAAGYAFVKIVAARPGTGFDTSTKPDPEMDRLAEEIAACTKRVFTPDPAAGSAAPPTRP